LVSVPKILPTAATCVTPPVNPIPEGEAHVYVVPAGINPFVPFTGLTVNNTPPQVVELIGEITGIAFTVTVTVNVAFTPQSVENGVIV